MTDLEGDEAAKNVRDLIPEIRIRTEVASLPTSGRLQVDTKASIYVIDFEASTVLRVPGAAGGTATVATAILRQDHKPISLCGIEQLIVGLPMRLVLTGLAESGTTLRKTTEVTRIRWVTNPSS